MTNLSKYDIILNMSWLQKHDFQISFVHWSLTFNFNYCMINCLFNECFIVIYNDDASKKQHKFFDKHKKYDDIYEIFAYTFNQIIKKKNHDLIVMWSEHFKLLNQSESNDRYLCVIMINEIIAIIAKNYEKFFIKNNKFFLTIDELKKRLFKHYHDRIKIFNLKTINKLSSHKKIDHNIDLQFETISSAKKIYELSREQALIIKTYIENMRQKDFIKYNSSSYVAPILIVKKLNENLQICVNYRIFNNVIIKNRNASSLLRDILARLCQVKIYNKFDIIVVFNEIRMKFEHEEKIAFITRYKLFEYIVMFFDLCNVFETFQIFINKTF